MAQWSQEIDDSVDFGAPCVGGSGSRAPPRGSLIGQWFLVLQASLQATVVVAQAAGGDYSRVT